MSQRDVYSFEKLRVWESAWQLAKRVYLLTGSFPRAEVYGLTAQLNRAALSVARNLAEASARTSRKDQAHFSGIAGRSLMELACLLRIAVDLEYLAVADEAKLRQTIQELSRQLNAPRKAQLS